MALCLQTFNPSALGSSYQFQSCLLATLKSQRALIAFNTLNTYLEAPELLRWICTWRCPTSPLPAPPQYPHGARAHNNAAHINQSSYFLCPKWGSDMDVLLLLWLEVQNNKNVLEFMVLDVFILVCINCSLTSFISPRFLHSVCICWTLNHIPDTVLGNEDNKTDKVPVLVFLKAGKGPGYVEEKLKI